MNLEIKKLWLENLSNGKYQEMKEEYWPKDYSGDFTLRWKNYYTPFGVLCDMYAKFFGKKECWKSNFNKNYPDEKNVSFMGNDWVIPDIVLAWAWFKVTPEQEREMWNMSFADASKYIEANF